jgi:hypothetical protein
VTAPKKSSFIHIFFISGVYYFPLLKIEEWGQNHRRWQFWPWNLLVTCATETGQNHRRWQFWPWNLLVTCAAETHICCKLKFEEGYFLKCIYMYIVPLSINHNTANLYMGRGLGSWYILKTIVLIERRSRCREDLIDFGIICQDNTLPPFFLSLLRCQTYFMDAVIK